MESETVLEISFFRNYTRHTDDNVTPTNFQNNAYTFEANEMKERKEGGGDSPPPDYAEPTK